MAGKNDINGTLEGTQELTAALLKAESLHKGVGYGNGLDVFDQVRRCAEIALNQAGNIELAKLALLHKSQEAKKISGGIALASEDVEKIAGSHVAGLVTLLGTKPERNGQNEQTLWNQRAQWAKTLPPMAQQMLLIEKITNFETSRDNPRSDWTPEQHVNYIETRMQVVDACKNADPALYAFACETRDEVLAKLSTTQTATPDNGERSWGDRFKRFVFNKTTYVAINYFVNAIGSAALTYAFKRTFEDTFRKFSSSIGDKYGKTAAGMKKIAGGVYGGIEGILLTSVGNALVPVIKSLEDRRHSIEYKLGHALDKMQERFGYGNNASKQNLADHGKIERALYEKQTGKLTAQELERFEAKHHLAVGAAGNLEFKEHRLPWTKVLTARLGGWVAATITSIVLRVTDKNENEKLRFAHYEDKIGPKIGRVVSKIPGFSRMFADSNLLGKLLLQDAIMTVSSSSTHALVQGVLHKKKKPEEIEQEEEMRAQANERNKKFATGSPKDFRTREETKTAEPSMSI